MNSRTSGNGREIKVQSERIPAYAYVICDTTKEVEIIAENKGDVAHAG